MKKEYIAPRAAAIRLAMEDTMLTGSKLSTDGSANSDITISDDTYEGQGRRIKLNYLSTACLSSPHSIPLSVVLD